MSGLKTFTVAGAGNIGKFIIEALLKLQKEGKVTSVSFLSRQVSGYMHNNKAKSPDNPITHLRKTGIVHWSQRAQSALSSTTLPHHPFHPPSVAPTSSSPLSGVDQKHLQASLRWPKLLRKLASKFRSL